MQKRRPIFYNALLLTGVNLLLRLVGTLFGVYLSTRIGAEGLGLMQLVMSVNGLALTAGMGGIRTATMYLCAEKFGRGEQNALGSVLRGCMGYSLIFSCGIGGAFYLLAPWVSTVWIGVGSADGALRIFALFLPVFCLTGVLTGYFTAAHRITTLAAVEVLEQLFYIATASVLLALWQGSQPSAACEALVLSSGLSSLLTLCILLALYARQRSKKTAKQPTLGRLVRTALPLALADDLKSGIGTTENILVPKRLSRFSGCSTPLAAFGTVTGMVFPLMMLPSAILSALAELLVPELAGCNAAGHTSRIRHLVKKTLKTGLIYGCSCFVLLFCCAEALCQRLYNSAEAGRQLRLYSLLIPILYCDLLTDAMVKGLGQQLASVRYNIITSVMDVALLFVLLPRWGMYGYFASFTVTHLINFMLSIRRLAAISGAEIRLRIPMATLAAALGAVLLTSPVVNTPLRLMLTALCFGATLSLLGVMTKKDVLWLKAVIRNK